MLGLARVSSALTACSLVAMVDFVFPPLAVRTKECRGINGTTHFSEMSADRILIGPCCTARVICVVDDGRMST